MKMVCHRVADRALGVADGDVGILVPSARPIKLATPIGACLGNKLQNELPTESSNDGRLAGGSSSCGCCFGRWKLWVGWSAPRRGWRVKTSCQRSRPSRAYDSSADEKQSGSRCTQRHRKNACLRDGNLSSDSGGCEGTEKRRRTQASRGCSVSMIVLAREFSRTSRTCK